MSCAGHDPFGPRSGQRLKREVGGADGRQQCQGKDRPMKSLPTLLPATIAPMRFTGVLVGFCFARASDTSGPTELGGETT